MSKSPGLLIAGLTALSLGILGLGTWMLLKPSAQGESTGAEETAPPSLVTRDVTALGRIEPEGGVYTVASPTSSVNGSSRVLQLLVKEGDEVTQGQPLAVMDSYAALQAAVLQANANLTEAQANFNRVQVGAKSGDVDAQIANAQASEFAKEMRRAAVNAQMATIRAQEEEIAGLKAQVDRVIVEGRKAEKDLIRFRELAEGGAIADSELDIRILAFEAKVKELEQAKQSVKRAQSEKVRGERQLEEAILRFKESEKEFERSKFQVDGVKEVLAEDLDVARAQVLVAEAALQRAIVDRDTTGTVTSPIEGQVLKVNAEPGESVGNQGLAELARTQAMNVIAEVYETDVNRVAVGQAAAVTSPVLDQPIAGRVVQVGLQVSKKDVLDSDPVADTDARVVEVKIRLDNPEPVKSLTNLQVNVKIDT